MDAIVQGPKGPVRVQGRIDLLSEGAQGNWCMVDHKMTDACGTAEEIAKTVKTSTRSSRPTGLCSKPGNQAKWAAGAVTGEEGQQYLVGSMTNQGPTKEPNP